jgi:hypothetical protein
MTEILDTSFPPKINRKALSQSILSLIPEEDIYAVVRLSLIHFGRQDQFIYGNVLKSPYYSQLVNGTLGELIDFLRSFENKTAC